MRLTLINKKYLLLLIGVICLFFVVLNRRYDNEKGHFMQPTFSEEVEEILHEQRLEIEKEMEGYPYDVLSGRNIRELSDLIMERGGKPVRSVIVSTWRSGSTFFGELVSAHPASYFYFEPLMGLGVDRAPLTSQKPLNIVESVFKCNFSELGEMLNFRRKAKWRVDRRNKYLNKQCVKNESLCHETEFSTRFCRLFPFQVVKIVALDLASMDHFLQDKNLGVKIVFLVRDPRGVMRSREDLDWCKKTPMCIRSDALCSNMVSDYISAVDFSKRYPESFKVVRYEDFSRNPYQLTQQIYSFYGIHFHNQVKRFIDTHTKVSSHDDAFSTIRNTSGVTFQWKEKLTFDQVNEIQKHCLEAMKYWGYNLAIDHHHQRTFNSLRPLSAANINYFQ